VPVALGLGIVVAMVVISRRRTLRSPKEPADVRR
jgi:hypothetical protein